MSAAALVLAVAVGASPPAPSPSASPAGAGLAAAVADGDAHYARRAEGAAGDVALPAQIDAAIASYRRALELAPSSVEARWKLLRGMFFRGAFCGAEREERRRLFEDARRLADESLAPLRTAEARKATPQAALLHFWAAAAWGEWAQARGVLAAARAGAAGRIRDLAQVVVDLDPDLENGGGWRILGRLHDLSPKIPFITGWVSHRKSVELLRLSLERGPDNTVSQFFLAEALLRHEPSRRDEARRLLEACAAASARPAWRVEDAFYIGQARRRLAELK